MKRLAGREGVELSWHRGHHLDRYSVDDFASRLASLGTAGPVEAVPAAELAAKNRELFTAYCALQGEFDVYHPTYYEAATVKIPRRRRTVLTVHDLIPEKYMADIPRFRQLLDDRRELIATADFIQATSENTRRDLLATFPVDPGRVRVTYWASCMGNVASLPPPPHQSGRPYFLYVGTRSKYKNFEVLLRAFASSGILRQNYAVVCFGGTGDFVEPEVEFMQRHGMAECFAYVQGDDATLKGYYEHAVSLVYTSRYEGFGLPLLEAMECGCPPICCSLASVPEVVGDHAIFFDPDDPAGLAMALERVAGDRALRETLSLGGRARGALFSWDRAADQTHALYQEAVR